uniref:Uncharacterized protein n=1 Tax=Avena sativa TaxID=4498 RepID=A0ACD5ZXP8_AVESA
MLNKMSILDDSTTKMDESEKEMKLHQTNDINMQYREGGSKTMSRDIDINLPNITIITKHYANLQLNPARQKKRSEIIEDARKKYFFYDDATPSFRLLEYEDDTGKQIEEPDLWRPSDMDDETYRKKIEEAKFLADQDGQKKGVEMASIKTPEKQCSEHSKMNEEINGADYSSSVQCAQRQPSCTDLTESPIQERQKKQNDLFVDLVTPEATKKFYMKSRIEDTSNNKRNDYTKAILVGRNLFPNDVDDESVEIENVSSSNRNFLQRANVLSELEIFGERNFKDTCNIMCNEADNMYNTKLCLGSSNSSASKENFIPRRVLNASRYICSPYDINQMIIKPSEIKYYEAITTLCDIDEFKYKWAIKFDNCKVSVLQLGNSMKLNGWVESYVVNVFCRKLFKDNHPRTSNKHYFFSTKSDYLLEKWKNEESRERWRENVIKGLQAANSARSLHLSERNFMFLDSFYGKDCTYSKKASKMLIDNFKTAWYEAGLKQMHFENFGIVYPNVPKQNNGDDCGIFAIKYMELYCPRNPSSCRFTWKDIPNIRIKLANELQFLSYNEEEESMLRVQNFDPKELLNVFHSMTFESFSLLMLPLFKYLWILFLCRYIRRVHARKNQASKLLSQLGVRGNNINVLVCKDNVTSCTWEES